MNNSETEEAKNTMEQNIPTEDITIGSFQDLMVKAYERGTSDKEITVGKLLEDLIFDLKHMLVR